MVSVRNRQDGGDGGAAPLGTDLALPDLALAWVPENALILVMGVGRSLIVPKGSQDDFLHFLGMQTASSVLSTEASMAAHYILGKTLYRRIPYFSKTLQNEPESAWQLVKNWFTCNALAMLFAFVVVYFAMVKDMPPDEYYSEPELVWATFPLKFVVVRAVCDIGFYALHRLIHLPQLYWLHKHHHVHKSCNPLTTNVQFRFMDLVLEGFIPAFLGVMVAEAIFGRMHTIEVNVLLTAMIYYETGSHAGKELPTVSYCPSVAVVTRWLGWETRNVRFHEDHHEFTHCNYGITQWCDVVARTYRTKDKK